MSIETYVNFNGNCREAVEYYAEVFETKKPEFMSFEEAPEDPDMALPLEARHLIMHVGLEIEGSMILFSDTFPDRPVTPGNNISLVISTDDRARIETLFNRMKNEGTVEMELQETFWSKCYGSLIDKFGIVWQFNHDDGTEMQ
jgi:PhnB protein